MSTDVLLICLIIFIEASVLIPILYVVHKLLHRKRIISALYELPWEDQISLDTILDVIKLVDAGDFDQDSVDHAIEITQIMTTNRRCCP